MGIVTNSMFDQFKDKIYSLEFPVKEEELLSGTFLLEKDPEKKLEVYYTPFDYLNEEAKVVMVGITPGLHQMKKAFSTVLELRDQDHSDEELLHEVKKSASFEGSMRKNLIAMLDELGLHSHLGLESTAELFGAASRLVYNTSILPHAVFFDGKNYNGSRPDMLKTSMLLKYIEKYFCPDMNRLGNPLIIPLGVNVDKAMKYLLKIKKIHAGHILTGFPHPSGSNGHRHKQFSSNKQQMREQIKLFFRKEF